MKELPKIYRSNEKKEFNNNSTVYYSSNRSSNIKEEVDKKTIIQKINDIFSYPNYVYKANVEITLKDKKLIKRIIGRNKKYIITMDNDLIPIEDILDIKSIKKT